MKTSVRISKTFLDFQADLRNHEINTTSKYVVVKSEKTFSDPEVRVSDKQKVYWQDGIPYLKIGTRVYYCHQGKDTNLYQKKKYAQERDKKALADHIFTKRHNLSQPTKKLGCPALITVARVLRMTQYKVMGSGGTKKKKEKISKIIKKNISERELIGEEYFFYSFPKQEDHKFHLMGTKATAVEPIDNRETQGESSAMSNKRKHNNVTSNCFVCDKYLQENDICVYSRSDIAKIIQKLLGAVSEECVMVIKQDDYLCHACRELVTRITQLESDLRTATLVLRALLRVKYSINFTHTESQESQIGEAENGTDSMETVPFIKDSLPASLMLRSENSLFNQCTPSEIQVRKREELVETGELIPCSLEFIQNLDAEEYEPETKHTISEDKLCLEQILPSSNEAIHSQAVEVDEPQVKLFVSEISYPFGEKVFNLEQDNSIQDHNYELRDILTTFNFEEVVDMPVENEEIVESHDFINETNEFCEGSLDTVFKCGMCRFKTPSAKEIKAHFLEFKAKEGYYCNICNFGFHRKNLYRQHSSHHAELNETRHCIFCDETTHDRLHMKFHIEEKHKKNPFSHVCPYCNVVLLFERTMKDHIVRAHKKQTVYTCNMCQSKFYDRLKYNNHIEYLHRSQLNCKICNKTCASIRSLFLHEYQHKRLAIPYYFCSFCPKKFAKEVNLTLHEEQHTGTFEFKCDVCGYGFHEFVLLETHKKHKHRNTIKMKSQ